MSQLSFALLVIALLAVAASLATGLIAMASGGDFNRRNGNRLMRLRVISQAAALVLFLLFLLTR